MARSFDSVNSAQDDKALEKGMQAAHSNNSLVARSFDSVNSAQDDKALEEGNASSTFGSNSFNS